MVAPIVAAAGVSALGSIAGAGIGALTSQPASSNAWQIPIQTQHDFDMFNLQQTKDWSMYNAQVEDNRENAYKAYEQQVQLTQAAAQWQREWESTMAQNSIGWRVADAQRAGVSPLVALGAPTFNPNPISIGNVSPAAGGSPSMGGGGGSSIGASGAGPIDNSWIGRLGANVGDIAAKALTPEDARAIAQGEITFNQNTAIKDEQIKGLKIDNARKLAEARAANPGAGINPLDGQNPALGKFTNKPPEVATVMPSQPQNIAGVYGEVQINRTATGYTAVPSKQSGIQDQQFDNPLFASWFGRNNIGPDWTPPVNYRGDFPGSVGIEWSGSRQQYVPIYPSGYMYKGQRIPYGHYKPGSGTGSIQGVMP
ncbi:DNA pilot protein [robinz microvirus RP_48]|nr:DNA pilot protein [robinz microvirus RP_48]